MKINVFGLGYVGCVTATCLANQGHSVVGIDLDSYKVRCVNEGRSPFVETGLDLEISRAVKAGRLAARTNELSDLNGAELSLVCVGTPSLESGKLDLEGLERVSREIGLLLREAADYHVVDVRSTVLPGVTEGMVVPTIESASRKKAGRDFGVCMNPEFLREGTAIADFRSPPLTVVGEIDARSGNVVASAYAGVDAPLVRTSLRSAEMVKYACNCYHALKITFANEIGNLCKKLGVDSHEVMNIFCRDTKLNVSPAYLMPGFAFGGSCLPKDVKAVLHKARELDLDLPMLSSVLVSNGQQIDHAFDLIRKTGMTRVGVLGISFKTGTDDLRESPMVELVERMIGKGYEVSVFDEEVRLSRLHGANKRHLEATIPHIASLMKDDPADVARCVDVIVVGRRRALESLGRGATSGKVIVDLVGALDPSERNGCRYEGLAW